MCDVLQTRETINQDNEYIDFRLALMILNLTRCCQVMCMYVHMVPVLCFFKVSRFYVAYRKINKHTLCMIFFIEMRTIVKQLCTLIALKESFRGDLKTI